MMENRAIDEGRVWQEFCHIFLRVNGEDAMFSYGLAVPQMPVPHVDLKFLATQWAIMTIQVCGVDQHLSLGR